MKDLVRCGECDMPLADFTCVNPRCALFAAVVTTTRRSPCSVGSIIRQRRLERGLSLRQLADEIGKSFGWLSKVERGVEVPGYDTLVHIAVALGMDTERLLWQAGEPMAWMARLLREGKVAS